MPKYHPYVSAVLFDEIYSLKSRMNPRLNKLNFIDYTQWFYHTLNSGNASGNKSHCSVINIELHGTDAGF